MPRFATPEQTAQNRKDRAQRQRDWLKSLTPEQRLAHKQDIEQQKKYRQYDREERKRVLESKKKVAREMKILKFMLKTDVLYLHHGQKDSMKKEIHQRIDSLKNSGNHLEYDSYYWNYNEAQTSYMPLSQLRCLWYGNFDSIYDVPLDGTYRFHIYDSGARGLGSMNHITCEKVEVEVKAPYVNPGALIPITVR